MVANLLGLPLENLSSELETASAQAHQDILKGGPNLPKQDLVRLATIIYQANQLLTMSNMVKGVVSSLMDSMASPAAPASKKEH
jgi:hypothetical protein